MSAFIERRTSRHAVADNFSPNPDNRSVSIKGRAAHHSLKATEHAVTAEQKLQRKQEHNRSFKNLTGEDALLKKWMLKGEMLFVIGDPGCGKSTSGGEGSKWAGRRERGRS